MDQPAPTADDIRRQMHITRQRVRAEVNEVVDGAKQLADWRFYPRQFPWLTLGAATAVGFAAIPRRREPVAPDIKALEAFAREHKLEIEPGKSTARKAGVMGAVLATAGSALLRFGVAYAGRELTRRLGTFEFETVREPST